MKALLTLLLATLFLAGCASAPSETAEAAAQERVKELALTLVSQDSDEAQKYVYQFQHRLLPDWTHHSNGQFYEELRAGDDSYFREVAAEMLTEEYANQIEIHSVHGKDAVLITFPEPKSFTHCYFVLIIKHLGVDGALDTFEYITLEKTVPRKDHPKLAVLGDWSAEGSHGNYGARAYTDAQSFLDDVLFGSREVHVRTTPASANENNE